MKRFVGMICLLLCVTAISTGGYAAKSVKSDFKSCSVDLSSQDNLVPVSVEISNLMFGTNEGTNIVYSFVVSNNDIEKAVEGPTLNQRCSWKRSISKLNYKDIKLAAGYKNYLVLHNKRC